MFGVMYVMAPDSAVIDWFGFRCTTSIEYEGLYFTSKSNGSAGRLPAIGAPQLGQKDAPSSNTLPHLEQNTILERRNIGEKAC